jgi:hypothetical protein
MRTASRIRSSVSCFVGPVATQPGRSGEYAEKLPFALSMTIKYCCTESLLQTCLFQDTVSCPGGKIIFHAPGNCDTARLEWVLVRWLPFCATRYQPSSSSSLIASRTVTSNSPFRLRKLTHHRRWALLGSLADPCAGSNRATLPAVADCSIDPCMLTTHRSGNGALLYSALWRSRLHVASPEQCHSLTPYCGCH